MMFVHHRFNIFDDISKIQPKTLAFVNKMRYNIFCILNICERKCYEVLFK